MANIGKSSILLFRMAYRCFAFQWLSCCYLNWRMRKKSILGPCLNEINPTLELDADSVLDLVLRYFYKCEVKLDLKHNQFTLYIII